MSELANITLEHPYWLLGIVPFLLCHYRCPMRSQAIFFPNLSLISSLQSSHTRLLGLLKWSAVLFLLLSLSSPVIENKIVTDNRVGYDITMLLDTSGSMKQKGFDQSNPGLDKFSAVKSVAGDFITKRESDNIALVVFGDFAFIASPLTYDKKMLKKILARLEIGLAGDRTAIYDALGLSSRLFQNSKAKSKIAILLTDGVNTAGSVPLKVALELVQKEGIKVYTIGIGNLRDFDPELLRYISQESGGRFYKATDASALERVYAEINSLERSEIKGKSILHKNYLYQYPLFAGFIAFLLLIYFRNRRGL